MASNLGSMVLELSANVARFQSDMGKAAYISQQAAEKMQKTMQGAIDGMSSSLKNLAGSLVAAFSVDRLVEFGKQAIDVADEVGKMAQKIGISVEALSALQLQAKLSNTSNEELQVGLSKLAKSAADAAGGGKQSAAVYSALGVSVKDAAGNLKPMEVLLGDVAAKFATYRDSAAKTALAQEVFGKSGANLIPYLNELGQKSLPEVIKQADEFGSVISTKTAKQAEDFNDNLTRLSAEAHGFANAVISQLLPSLVKLTDQMVEAGKTTDKYSSSSSEVAGAIKKIIFALATGFEGFKLWNTTLQDFFEVGKTVFSAFGQVIQIWSETTAKAIKAAFSLDSAGLDAADKEFKDRMAGVGDGIAGAMKKANDDITNGVSNAVANAKKSYDSLLGTFANVESGVTSVSKKIKDAPLVPNKAAQDAADKALQKIAADYLDMQKVLDSLAGKLGGPYDKAWNDYASAIDQAAKSAEKYKADLVPVAAIQKFIAEATSLATQRFREQTDATHVLDGVFDKINHRYAEQNALIGLTGEALQVETEYQKLLNDALKEMESVMGPLTEEQQKRLESLHGLAEEQIKFTNSVNRDIEASQQWQSIWAQAGQSVADTFAKILVNGGSLFNSLKDLAKQTVEQIIAYFAKLSVINPILNSIFGGQSGWTQLAQLGSSAGGLASSGAISGGGSYNLLSAGGSSGLSSLLTIGAGIVAGLSAFKSAGGGFGGAAAGATYGYGTYAAGTAVSAGIAAGSITAGLAAIPVVGWIAIAAMVIDKFSGGKLFGTSGKVVGGNQTTTVDDMGINVATSYTTKGQRALFGGSYWKEHSSPTDPATLKAADDFFAALKTGTEAFAKSFGVTMTNVVGGTFNTSFDAKGNPTGTTSTVLGVKRTGETQQQFAERLQADSFLAVLDKMGLGASEFTKGLQEDADALFAGVQDFAQATTAANTDLGKGFHFLALSADATLVDVMKFAEGAQAAGESLSQTYARLAQAQAQYNQFVAQFVPATQYVDDFEAGLSQVYHAMLSNIDAANQLAIAAGASGAAQQDLTNIQNLAAQQMAALTAQLEASAQSLAFSLGLTTQGSLSQVTDEITRLQAKAGQTSSATSGATKSLGQFVSAVADVAKAADNAVQLLLGNLSPLNDQQKLQIALQGLRAGTVSQETVLGIGRSLYASSQAYTDLFNQVTHMGGQQGSQPRGNGVLNAVGMYMPADTSATAGAGLSAAEQAKLDALLKQQAALQAAATMQQYQTLAQQIAEIASAKGETYQQILDEMGVQAADLEKGLGIKSDADLNAYIAQIQAQMDSGHENTLSIVSALSVLPQQIADAIFKIGMLTAPLPGTAPGAPIATPPPAPPPSAGTLPVGGGAPPGGRTLSDSDLQAMAGVFGRAAGDQIISKLPRNSRVAA
jgi:hypothetical protein